MSKRMFYLKLKRFENTLPDYSTSGENDTNCDFVPDLINSYVEQIERRFKPEPHRADGGIYSGVQGVAFMYWKMARSEAFKEQRAELLEKALTCIKIGIGEANRVPPTSGGGLGASFLLGHAGSFGLASVIYHELGDSENESKFVKRYLEMAQILQPDQKWIPQGANDLFAGRTGYLCMTRWLHRMLGKNVVPSDLIELLFNTIVAEGRSYSLKHKSESPLMYSYYDTEYLGAAHGLSSVIQMLLCFPEFFDGKSEIETDMKRATEFMLSVKRDDNNYRPTLDEEPGMGDLVQWCHGAPGVVYLMVKAYKQWNEEKYLKAVFECGEVAWEKGLLTKGPGICHGVAGNAYVFLLLYRFTKDEKYFHRAVQFAKFLTAEEFLEGARRTDAPYSLYEGVAGTVCFLLDLLQPEQAEFPFFDVL